MVQRYDGETGSPRHPQSNAAHGDGGDRKPAVEVVMRPPGVATILAGPQRGPVSNPGGAIRGARQALGSGRSGGALSGRVGPLGPLVRVSALGALDPAIPRAPLAIHVPLA